MVRPPLWDRRSRQPGGALAARGGDDKSGKITAEHAPILARLGIAEKMWCDLVWNFKKYFGKSRGPGSPDRMREEAILGVRKFQPGQKMVRKCFV